MNGLHSKNLSTRLSKMHACAEKTFGSRLQAEEWLNKYHPLLGDSPIAIAKTEIGLMEVEKTLTAIWHGSVV